MKNNKWPFKLYVHTQIDECYSLWHLMAGLRHKKWGHGTKSLAAVTSIILSRCYISPLFIVFPYIPLQSSRHEVHTDVCNDNHVMVFASDKRFGFVDRLEPPGGYYKKQRGINDRKPSSLPVKELLFMVSVQTGVVMYTGTDCLNHSCTRYYKEDNPGWHSLQSQKGESEN
jgi:hypothetical protein